MAFRYTYLLVFHMLVLGISSAHAFDLSHVTPSKNVVDMRVSPQPGAHCNSTLDYRQLVNICTEQLQTCLQNVEITDFGIFKIIDTDARDACYRQYRSCVTGMAWACGIRNPDLTLPYVLQ